MKPRPPATTTILRSYYHTPTAAVLAAFPVVLRAGHLRAAADYAIERRRSPGHDLLLCVAGAGRVRLHNRDFAVARGELAWINGYEPHSHRADPAAPWELLWLRMDGAGLEALRRLLGADANPVFHCATAVGLRSCYREILRLMAGPAMHREENVHIALARLVAILRRSRPVAGRPGRELIPKQMEVVINRMALYPHRPWTAKELARLAGLSVPRFYRLFRQITGSSPIDWLRQERINLAKRRLQGSDDSIKAVADQAGYNSPFFFSRDFKRHTGMSPSEFRRHERGESFAQPPPTPTMR